MSNDVIGRAVDRLVNRRTAVGRLIAVVTGTIAMTFGFVRGTSAEGQCKAMGGNPVDGCCLCDTFTTSGCMDSCPYSGWGWTVQPAGLQYCFECLDFGGYPMDCSRGGNDDFRCSEAFGDLPYPN